MPPFNNQFNQAPIPPVEKKDNDELNALSRRNLLKKGAALIGATIIGSTTPETAEARGGILSSKASRRPSGSGSYGPENPENIEDFWDEQKHRELVQDKVQLAQGLRTNINEAKTWLRSAPDKILYNERKIRVFSSLTDSDIEDINNGWRVEKEDLLTKGTTLKSSLQKPISGTGAKVGAITGSIAFGVVGVVDEIMEDDISRFIAEEQYFKKHGKSSNPITPMGKLIGAGALLGGIVGGVIGKFSEESVAYMDNFIKNNGGKINREVVTNEVTRLKASNLSLKNEIERVKNKIVELENKLTQVETK